MVALARFDEYTHHALFARVLYPQVYAIHLDSRAVDKLYALFKLGAGLVTILESDVKRNLTTSECTAHNRLLTRH